MTEPNEPSAPKALPTRAPRGPLRKLAAVSARGAFWMLLSQGIIFGTNFIGVVILARFLTPSDFGIMAMAATVSNLIMMFRDAGLTTPVVQRNDLSHAQLSALYWVNVAFGVTLAVATILMAPVVAWFYDQPDLTVIVAVLATGFLIGTTGALQDAMLRRNLRFRALAIIKSTAALVALIAGIAAAWLGYGIWALVVMRLAQTATQGLGSWLVSRWRPGWYQRGTEVKSLLAVAGHVSGSQLAIYLSRNSDNVLIGWYWGEHLLGLYAQAYKLLMFPLNQIGPPLNSVMLPLLSKLQGDPAAYRSAYRRVTEKVVILTMPLTCLMLVFPGEVIHVLLGPQWADAAPILAWFGIAMIYQPVAATTGCLLMSQGRTGLLMRQGLVSSVVTVLAFAVALPFGPEWVAASFVVSGLVLRLPMIFWQIGREGPIRTSDQYRLFIPSLWSGALLCLAFYGLKLIPELSERPLLMLLCAAAVTVPVTCAALAVLRSGRALMRDSVTILKLALSRSHAG
ncbi:MAG TPA: lipopolysaccharide biosynthesis protein [Dongiaceae bacterium]|nr:lipopolysaccharide biosynthesis protein [Dongiaceae bacterium]